MRLPACPRVAGLFCPREGCPGLGDPAVCRHLDALRRNRETPPPPPDPESLRLAMAADLCDLATGPCGCGGGPPRTCLLGGWPAEVRRPDCLRCVAIER